MADFVFHVWMKIEPNTGIFLARLLIRLRSNTQDTHELAVQATNACLSLSQKGL